MLPRRIVRVQRIWLCPKTCRWQLSALFPTQFQGTGERLDIGIRLISMDPTQSQVSEGEQRNPNTTNIDSQSARTNGSPQLPSHGSRGAPSLAPEPSRTHQFDTFKLVSALQLAGYSHSQAVALMKCLRTVLINGNEVAKAHYLSRGDLENVQRSCSHS
jgi:hypothetical protein